MKNQIRHTHMPLSIWSNPGAPLILGGLSGHGPQQWLREQKGVLPLRREIGQRGSPWWVGLLTPLPGVEV